MGNILPLPCHGEVKDLEAGTGAKTRRKQQQRPDRSMNVWAARSRHAVVPVVDAPENGGGGGSREKEAWAWPEYRVEPAGGHGEDGGLRVRIVMKRKDIAQLVATLQQRGAEVVSTELAGCNGNADGWATMISPRRDAWRPRLSIIPENF